MRDVRGVANDATRIYRATRPRKHDLAAASMQQHMRPPPISAATARLSEKYMDPSAPVASTAVRRMEDSRVETLKDELDKSVSAPAIAPVESPTSASATATMQVPHKSDSADSRQIRQASLLVAGLAGLLMPSKEDPDICSPSMSLRCDINIDTSIKYGLPDTPSSSADSFETAMSTPNSGEVERQRSYFS